MQYPLLSVSGPFQSSLSLWEKVRVIASLLQFGFAAIGKSYAPPCVAHKSHDSGPVNGYLVARQSTGATTSGVLLATRLTRADTS